MRQVLLNLLSNAVSASPPDGRITLRSELLADVWRITVDDEGPGLDAEQRSRIFERFVRFNHAGSDDKGKRSWPRDMPQHRAIAPRPHLAAPARTVASAGMVIEIPSAILPPTQDSVRSISLESSSLASSAVSGE